MGHVVSISGAERPRVSAPPPAPRLAILPTTGGRGGEYALADVARSLGLIHFGVRTIVDKLRILARHSGMPLPRTPRIVAARPVSGPLVIYSKSRWDAGEFDAWLDGRGPAGPAAVATPAAPVAPAIVVEMQRRAAALAGA